MLSSTHDRNATSSTSPIPPSYHTSAPITAHISPSKTYPSSPFPSHSDTDAQTTRSCHTAPHSTVLPRGSYNKISTSHPNPPSPLRESNSLHSSLPKNHMPQILKHASRRRIFKRRVVQPVQKPFVIRPRPRVDRSPGDGELRTARRGDDARYIVVEKERSPCICHGVFLRAQRIPLVVWAERLDLRGTSGVIQAP